jgi:formylglycine-generating enzyme required for sulfatase activity
MPSEAFVLKNGKKYGPFSTSQLRQLAAAHEIGPDDLIKRDRESLPVPARTIAGLLDAFDPAAGHLPAVSSEPGESGDWISEVLAHESQSGATDSREHGMESETVEPPAAAVANTDRAVNRIRENTATTDAETKTDTKTADPTWLTTPRVPPNFDPYHIWLGIPKGKRPPTHYQLLRISSGERADEVIEGAAERQAEYIRKCRIGEYAILADRILYEIEEAKLCLLNPRLRKDYDEKLAEGKPKPAAKPIPPPPTQIVGEGNEIVRTYLGVMSVLVGAFAVMALFSFLLPWKKIALSQTAQQQPADAGGLNAANQQAAPAAGNAALGAVLPPAAPKNPPAAAPRQAIAPRENPKPTLLVAPFNETSAKEAQANWAAYLKTPAQLTNSNDMKFVLVPPGEFMMGSEDPRLPQDVRPVHRVRITKPLYFGVHEVTQEEFQRIMGYNPSHFSENGDNPLETVSVDAIETFLERLSESGTEKRAGRRYRLPTEAEWEYTCRAGTTTGFQVGDAMTSDQANFNGRSEPGEDLSGPNLRRTTKVGSYGPNAFGLYDMHGNVIEAVSDWYSAEYYSVSPVDDPQGPPSGELRIGRGGSWAHPAVPSAYRFTGPSTTVDATVGYRVVCEISLPSKPAAGAVANPVAPKGTPASPQRSVPKGSPSPGL